jgi:hypothetical protein
VSNAADQCPNTPAGQPADANGCALSQRSVVLTVTPQGPPLDSVTSDDGGIACGTDCTQSYAGGTMVTLRARRDVQQHADRHDRPVTRAARRPR